MGILGVNVQWFYVRDFSRIDTNIPTVTTAVTVTQTVTCHGTRSTTTHDPGTRGRRKPAVTVPCITTGDYPVTIVSPGRTTVIV